MGDKETGKSMEIAFVMESLSHNKLTQEQLKVRVDYLLSLMADRLESANVPFESPFRNRRIKPVLPERDVVERVIEKVKSL